MTEYQQRLQLVRRILEIHNLLPTDRSLPIFCDDQPRDGDRTLLALTRDGHELKIKGISDGGIALVFSAASPHEDQACLTLLGDVDDQWYIKADHRFERSNSAPLHELWSKLPERADVNSGRLKPDDRFKALIRFAYAISSL